MVGIVTLVGVGTVVTAGVVVGIVVGGVMVGAAVVVVPPAYAAFSVVIVGATPNESTAPAAIAKIYSVRFSDSFIFLLIYLAGYYVRNFV